MIDIHILITILIIGNIVILYLSIGLVLKEFKSINLPFVKSIYDFSFNMPKFKKGFWTMDFQGKKICSSCKVVFTEKEWEQFEGIPDRCPKCGSRNNIG